MLWSPLSRGYVALAQHHPAGVKGQGPGPDPPPPVPRLPLYATLPSLLWACGVWSAWGPGRVWAHQRCRSCGDQMWHYTPPGIRSLATHTSSERMLGSLSAVLLLRAFPVGAMPTPRVSQITSSWTIRGHPSSTSCPCLTLCTSESLIPQTLGPMTSCSTEGRGRGHRAGAGW